MSLKNLYVIFDSDTGDLVPPFALNTDGAARQSFKKFILDARKNGSLDDFTLYKVGCIDWDIAEVSEGLSDSTDFRFVYELGDCNLKNDLKFINSSSDFDDKEDN